MNYQTLNVYDMCLLYNHFALKKKPTEQDKKMANKIDKHLVHSVQGLMINDSPPRILE